LVQDYLTAMILAKKLSKTFGSIKAVENVSLQVKGGEIYGLVGSDGAGKTTTLRLLVGALKPDGGEASICGYSVSAETEKARAQLGYLSQRFSLYEDLSVLENIRFFAELRGLARDEWLPRCLEILDFVGLEAFKDRRAGQLSGGMKQKLGLASALVTRPRVLLLDEPTTGVDPVTRQDFWQLIIKLVSASFSGEATSRAGRSVLLTTPYMDEASRCHRVGFMRAGRMIAEGSPSELRKDLQGRIIEVHAQNLPVLRRSVEQLKEVEEVQMFGDKLHLRVKHGMAQRVIDQLKSEPSVPSDLAINARLVTPSLEDVFINLSGGKL
jgi:ABC-2 type transport system ATP-binding protein